MYTELKEVCNFLCRYLHFRIPQVKVGIFAESLGNVLLLQYRDFWDERDPKKFEEYRRLSLSAVGPDDVSALKKAAALAALDFDELMACLPERVVVYVNPGEVLFSFSGQWPPMAVWTGPVDADRHYQPEPECIYGAKLAASVTELLGADPFERGTFTCLPGKRATVRDIHDGTAFSTAPHDTPMPVYLSDEALADWFVQLVLVDCSELGALRPFPYNGTFRLFHYVPPATEGMNFSCKKFADTRFGRLFSTLPDHERLRRLRSAMSAEGHASPLTMRTPFPWLSSNSDGSPANYHYYDTSSPDSVFSSRRNSAVDLRSGPPAAAYSCPTLAPLASQVPVPPVTPWMSPLTVPSPWASPFWVPPPSPWAPPFSVPPPAPWTAPFNPVTPQRHSPLTTMFAGVPGVHETLSSLTYEQERTVLLLLALVGNAVSTQ